MHSIALVCTALALASSAILAAPTVPDSASLNVAGSSTSHLDETEMGPSSALKNRHKHKGERYSNKVLLFRHGEKRSDSSIGLSVKGKKRAQCLRNKLGKSSRHNIGLILAEAYNPDTGKRRRPFDTVKGLAHDLGLKVDLSCEADDFKCVSERVAEYAHHGGTGDIAICWKHSYLHKIARELGAKETKPYPDDRYDLIWTLTHRRIVHKESEQCPGLDAPLRHDPDLEIDIAEEQLDYSVADAADENDELLEQYLGGHSQQIEFGLNKLG